MSFEQFLTLNMVVFALLAIVFFWGRRGQRSPTSLDMASKRFNSVETLADLEFKKLLHSSVDTNMEASSLFNYNGHTWDAYEVLGIPAGSSLEVIKEAFEKALRRSDVSSHTFFKLALTAVLAEMKQRGCQSKES